MSVSLALVPVALTMRLVMGKENYEKWVESSTLRIPTNFQTEREIARTVRTAGYDAEIYAGFLKTHLNGEDLYCFWELIDGKWSAAFSIHDSREDIERFIEAVNHSAGKHVIGDGIEREYDTDSTSHPEQLIRPTVFPTNFRDGELLFKTLKEFGINPVRKGSTIVCKVENSTLTFQGSDGSPYYVEIKNAPDMKKMYEYLSEVDEDYKRCLQSIVYEKLKKRVAEKKMAVESEKVLEDNSIILTINIRS